MSANEDKNSLVQLDLSITKEGRATAANTDLSHIGQPHITSWVSYGGNVLWIPVLALTEFGLLFVYSASSVYSAQYYGSELHFVKKQAMYLLPAICAAIIGAKFPLETFYKHIKFFYFTFVAMALATQIPHIGRKVGGASRWLNLGFVSFQPAEFLKIFTILFTIFLVTQKKKNWALNFCVILSPIAMLLQKDLGSTIVVMSACISILFMNGLPKRYLTALFIFLSTGLASLIVIEPYRIARIMTFLNPFKDPLGAGFQVIQSFVAVANGGFFGRGIGESQQKLFFLPEAHTDFILAVITEEIGFIGIIVLTTLYVVLYYGILRLIMFGKTQKDRLLAVSIFAMLGLTTIINMGVVVGALPTKGLPLPFISYGGSALVANYFLIGLMSQISKRTYS